MRSTNLQGIQYLPATYPTDNELNANIFQAAFLNQNIATQTREQGKIK
ncbi:MAG: hypothetical protein IT311_13030 [Anaerolineales bacterium]|nr:hypothetical protein [Anaerolineales bacterium]